MRISQIMLSRGYGGGERLFVDLCLSLADNGHLVQAICHPEFKGLTQLTHERLQIYKLTVRNDWSPFARFRLKQTFKIFNPAIIHTHFARGAAVAGSAGRSLNIPIIANMHNYVNLKYYRKIDYFLPGTNDQKKYLTQKGIPDEKITVIPHFSRFPIVEYPQLQHTNTASFVSYGRFVHKKGFHILLRSLRILHDRGLPAKLILGGDGPERNNIKKMTAELGLSEAVTFSGWIEDVPAFLSQSSFFVLPSLNEPFGIVVLEAMAQGKIIISTTTQGPREILDDTSAYLCSANNPIYLADALQLAWNEFDNAKQKAHNSLKIYRNLYSPKKVIPLLEKVYDRLKINK